MSSQKARIKGIVKLLVILVVGIFIGWIVATALILPPSSHQNIANKVQVSDATLGLNLTLKFEKTLEGGSFWTFRYENNITAAMWIQDVNTQSYNIIVASLMGNRINVTMPDGKKFEYTLYVNYTITAV